VLKQRGISGLVPKRRVAEAGRTAIRKTGSERAEPEVDAMRKLLLCGVLATAAMLPSGQSQAYEGPWCAIVNSGGGIVSEHCAMPTFEACREEAQRYGTTGFCHQNPRYPGYWAAGPAHRKTVHRKKHRRH
jgi:hypothetical protein